MNFLKKLFRSPAPAAPELGPREAAAALLVETAQADGLYDEREQAHIIEALMSAFTMSREAAQALLRTGEELVHAAVDHYRFTRIVKEQMDEAERVALVEQLWRVALADGERSAAEESFIRRITPLLAVDDRERILARQRAEARRAD